MGVHWDGINSFPLRWAAMQAGLGIVRKNNFFYTASGSWVGLMGYVTDVEGELIHDASSLRPCSEKCNLCQRACKSHALSAPYTMNPMRCVSFWTTFGKGVVPDFLDEGMFGEWICGCDDCQDACPHKRRHDWDAGEPFSDLEEIAPMMAPEHLVEQPDEFIETHIIPKTDNHLQPGDAHVLREGAARAIRNASRARNGMS